VELDTAWTVPFLHRSASSPSTTVVFPPETTQPVHVDAPPIFASAPRVAKRVCIGVRDLISLAPPNGCALPRLPASVAQSFCLLPSSLPPPTNPRKVARPLPQTRILRFSFAFFCPISFRPHTCDPLSCKPFISNGFRTTPSAKPLHPRGLYFFGGEGGGTFLTNRVSAPASPCVSPIPRRLLRNTGGAGRRHRTVHLCDTVSRKRAGPGTQEGNKFLTPFYQSPSNQSPWHRACRQRWPRLV
jgi:hypothetical protein